MTGCCARHGQEEFFGEKSAADGARRYRTKGPDPMARSLARRAAARGVEGATVLEIGGGIGQVALELLKAGATSAQVIELLPEYEPFVNELAAEAGVAERMSFATADLVADPAGVGPADLVVMNKVVCCTPDGVALAGIAASLARRTLVLSFPREVWWARAALGTVNLWLRLRRRRFRVFVHPQAAIERAVEAHGLARASERNGPLFRIAAFERV
jgi:magnesium-protoporphyrin O-methyltransferase